LCLSLPRSAVMILRVCARARLTAAFGGCWHLLSRQLGPALAGQPHVMGSVVACRGARSQGSGGCGNCLGSCMITRVLRRLPLMRACSYAKGGPFPSVSGTDTRSACALAPPSAASFSNRRGMRCCGTVASHPANRAVRRMWRPGARPTMPTCTAGPSGGTSSGHAAMGLKSFRRRITRAAQPQASRSARTAVGWGLARLGRARSRSHGRSYRPG
jgi:hypothetical protein